jgi:hypothetical protein
MWLEPRPRKLNPPNQRFNEILMSGKCRRDLEKRDVVCVVNSELNREYMREFRDGSANRAGHATRKAKRSKHLVQKAEAILMFARCKVKILRRI